MKREKQQQQQEKPVNIYQGNISLINRMSKNLNDFEELCQEFLWR